MEKWQGGLQIGKMDPSVEVEWEREEIEKTKVDYLEEKYENSFLHKGDDEKLIKNWD